MLIYAAHYKRLFKSLRTRLPHLLFQTLYCSARSALAISMRQRSQRRTADGDEIQQRYIMVDIAEQLVWLNSSRPMPQSHWQ